MQGLQAAIKLCANLLEQFEPAEAQEFAAFVLARISMDSGEPIQNGIRTAVNQWASMVLATTCATGKTIDGGNCTCMAACVVKHTNQGPLVIHYGAACPEFRNRFPMGGPTRAQDGIGWSNWYASEKQEQPGTVSEDDEPPPTKPYNPDEDSAKVRFSLLELK